MFPDWAGISGHAESGIKTVIYHYNRLLPALGVEFVRDEPADLYVIHAGMSPFPNDETPRLCCCHGLYWTSDLPSEPWQHKANRHVIDSLLAADQISVPSPWVAKTLQRDMHLDPIVLPHGIDLSEWQHSEQTGKYVIGYGKNRAGLDVCNPFEMHPLAMWFQDMTFVNTFAYKDSPSNVAAVGLLPHEEWKRVVQGALVYVSTTKETFGIGILEAMAAGVPVLSYRHGGAVDLVQHGVNGYLADPGDQQDLGRGLSYCLEHRRQLGENGRELANFWRWESIVGQVHEAFAKTIEIRRDEKYRPQQIEEQLYRVVDGI